MADSTTASGAAAGAPARVFTGWSEAPLSLAVRRLRAEHPGRPMDLRATMLIVPTRESGRRLRMALARAADADGGGVLSGPVRTPEALFQPPPSAGPVATSLAAQAAWMRVLAEIRADAFPHLLPSAPDLSAPGARLALAARLLRLQNLASEEGHDFASLAARLPPDMEPERWADLVRLEARYREALARAGLRDPAAAKIAAASAPAWPAGMDRLLVLFTPDPAPLALRALEGLSARGRVELWIHAPPEEAAAFDAFGRPVPAAWAARDLPLAEESLHGAADPDALAVGWAARLAEREPPACAAVALGVPESEHLPRLSAALRSRGIAAYDPAGRPALHTRPGRLLEALTALGGEAPDYAACLAVLRHPDVLALAGAQAGALLDQLDRLQREHAPVGLESLARAARTGAPLAAEAAGRLAAWAERLRGAPAAETLLEVLREVYREVRYDRADAADRARAEAVTQVQGAVEDWAVAEERVGLSGAEARALLRSALEHARIIEPRPDAARPLLGWLELAWEDAPELWIYGFREGAVPEAVVGDAFLPETARAEAGLRDNAFRLGRDAYLLASMLAWRAPGALRIGHYRHGADGDPVKPSRLLFRVPDAALPVRVRAVMNAGAAAADAPAWRAGWLLDLPEAPQPFRSVRITDFRTYLACPVSFYCTRALKMEAVEDRPAELDPMAFGSLAHTLLEQLPSLPGDDPDAWAAQLDAQARATLRERYGEELPVALRIQLDALVRRLRAAAGAEAALRKEGWTTLETEFDLEWEWEGMKLRGRVDRLDVHEARGVWRVLDYKTGDSAQSPQRAHWTTARAAGLELALSADGTRRWKDLQLPLYAAGLRACRAWTGGIECGYFLLPAKSADAGVHLFSELTDEIQADAEQCARRVLRRIRDGVFWPPGPTPAPELASLFRDGTGESLSAAARARLAGREGAV
jgi:ATP-dependent helicase/nuclease subunit B